MRDSVKWAAAMCFVIGACTEVGMSPTPLEAEAGTGAAASGGIAPAADQGAATVASVKMV